MIGIRKPLSALTAEDEARLLERGRSHDLVVARTVTEIIASVRDGGDAALRAMARRFDGAELDDIEVPRARWDAALDSLDPAVRDALERAADAIGRFHRWQLPRRDEMEAAPGVRLGRRPEPLRRVGVYAPGGRAAYPSSVLMGVVPARIAGVDEVVVCSPPAPDGRPPAAVLAACAIAGADRVYALGGAGAIAALALGTETVSPVLKVVGPGNAYVNEAKRQLTGRIGIDNPAGPSELLVVADDGADPDLIAVELMAQAEHDPDAAVALVTSSRRVADATAAALERRLTDQPRREIIAASLARSGAILTAGSPDAALAFVERYAPEHLLLLVDDPRAALDKVRAAGTVFLGPDSSVAFGDYVTGANHVLPTGGLARAYSGLSTADFVRWATWQEVDDAAAAALAAPAATLADAEGLPGHAMAARTRARRAGDSGRAAPPARVSLPRRAAYRDVELYDPRRGAVDVDLSDNTNLFGTAPAATRVLTEEAALARGYPTPYATALEAALAERYGVEPANVVTGCGSDDVIDSAIRAFCEPGAAVAYPTPTFPMAEIFARLNAARPTPVPCGPDFGLDAEALLATDATVIYLCSPNNPSGTAADAAAVEAVLRGARGVVLIDEAYAEFGQRSFMNEALRSGRAVVLRTFSKAFGLAGLRVGYGIGAAPVIAEIQKSRGPYKVGTLAEAACVAALREDRDWIDDTVRRAVESRSRLRGELEGRGLSVWPSSSNFLLFQRPEWADPAPGAEPAADAAAAIQRHGIRVRAYRRLPGAGDCLRVTAGPWALMERFLESWDRL